MMIELMLMRAAGAVALVTTAPSVGRLLGLTQAAEGNPPVVGYVLGFLYLLASTTMDREPDDPKARAANALTLLWNVGVALWLVAVALEFGREQPTLVKMSATAGLAPAAVLAWFLVGRVRSRTKA